MIVLIKSTNNKIYLGIQTDDEFFSPGCELNIAGEEGLLVESVLYKVNDISEMEDLVDFFIDTCLNQPLNKPLDRIIVKANTDVLKFAIMIGREFILQGEEGKRVVAKLEVPDGL